MNDNFDLRSLGLWVIPLGGLVGVVAFLGVAAKVGVADQPGMLASLLIGFVMIGSGAASLLVIWDRVRNRFIAIPIVLIALFVLLITAILCIGLVADLNR